MKKNEIVVGTEYAISRDNEWRQRQYGVSRVRVTGPAETKRRPGYGSGYESLVPVEYLQHENGEVTHTGVVPTRQFREEWGPYAEHAAEVAAWRRKAARKATDDRRARGEVVRKLIPALEAGGFEDEVESIFSENDAALYAEETGALVVEREEEYGGPYRYAVTPLARSLFDYWNKGSAIPVSGPTLLRLLEK